MKFLPLFASMSVLSLAAGTAMAQESVEWTGPYVSAQIGGFLDPRDANDERLAFDTDLDFRYDDEVMTAAGANAFSPGFCSGTAVSPASLGACVDNDDGGAEWGVRIGSDWQVRGNWVVGAVAEWADGGDYRDAVSGFSTTPAFYTMTRDVDYTMALRVRAGYVFGTGNNQLFYFTGGPARARLDNSFATSNTANSFREKDDHDATGAQWGFGYEYRVAGSGMSVGVEYIASRLEEDDHRVRAGGPAPATNPFLLGSQAGTDFQRSDRFLETESVRVIAGWHF